MKLLLRTLVFSWLMTLGSLVAYAQEGVITEDSDAGMSQEPGSDIPGVGDSEVLDPETNREIDTAATPAGEGESTYGNDAIDDDLGVSDTGLNDDVGFDAVDDDDRIGFEPGGDVIEREEFIATEDEVPGLEGTGFWGDDDYWSTDDRTAFESDNWIEDDYGTYDEDFVWETDDDTFDTWYEDDDDDWADYDDPGDAGWLDV